MINISQVKKYCNGDITKIENYDKALKSPNRFDCHHRLEISPTGKCFSVNRLKELGLYWNQSPDALIFLSVGEHTNLHRSYIDHKSKKGENNPMWGKHHSEETKAKLRKPKSEEAKRKMSESHKGKPSWNKGKHFSVGKENPMYGTHRKWWNNGKENVLSETCPNGFVHGRLNWLSNKKEEDK